METPETDTVRTLMKGLRAGEIGAAERLVEMFYPELRRIAAGRLRQEAPGHTLQATAIVHEFYLELRTIRQLKQPSENSNVDERGAFLALATHLIKRLLIHHSRPLAKQAQKLTLRTDAAPFSSPETELQEVQEAMEGLDAIDPKLRRVVEMRVFEGRSIGEIATELGCTTRTVDRYWSVSRAFLRGRLGEGA